MTIASDIATRQLADSLQRAEAERSMIPRRLGAFLGTGEGYGVQELTHELRTGAGARLVGFKVGLTVPEAQREFGASGPGYGRLYDTMVSAESGRVPVSTTPNAIGVECEVAVRLRHDLSIEELDAALDDESRTGEAIESMQVAAEIVTSRWDPPASEWEPWCADNGNSFQAVIGSPSSDVDPSQLFEGTITVHGETVGGLSQRIDRTLQWLCRSLRSSPTPLFPGAVILTGAVVGPLTLRAGDSAIVSIPALGSVEVTGY